jgi:type VI protein secretion system component VasK
VVLVSLGLCRLLLCRLGLSRPSAAALAATAASTCDHVFAAVHPAVAVPVRAAVAAHGVTLMLISLAALLLARRHLIPGVARMASMGGAALLLVLAMALVRLCRGRRLSGDRHGERKRDRTDKNLHLDVS